MSRAVPTLVFAIALAAVAHGAQSGKPHDFGVSLEPGAIHEECLRLERGARRRYEWSSSAPVDFNIHFHRGDDVIYPVKRDGATKSSDSFTAKSTEDYCWMWSAKSAVNIRGSID